MSYKISYEQKGVRLFLSASRRTDIVAIYCDWLFNRLKEGYVLVRNPHYYHQVGKINLSNKLIDCIIFWTKNPEKIYNRLEELKDYNYYFQITINNYGKEFEPVIPSIDKIINLVEKLSSKIGPKRIVWRYDPIVLTKEFDLKFHIQNFEVLASKLKNNINKCVFSFLDVYLQTEENLKKYGLIIIDELKMKEIAKKLSEVAQKYNIDWRHAVKKLIYQNLA